MAEPEDGALLFLVFSGGDLDQDTIDFFELNALADGVKGVGVGRSRTDLDRFSNRFGLGCAALGGECGLEMIAYDIGRDYLEESINGVFSPRLEGSEQTAIVLAKLEVGVLDQVVELDAGWFAKAASRSKHSRSDHQLEATDELGPRGPIFRACACSY